MELLRLPAEHGHDLDLLRRLARDHLCASRAAHVSRSYSDDRALVAWHTSAVGVDLERVQDADIAFARSICTPAEIERFGSRLTDPSFVISLWSSKEALAKALGDALTYDPRRLDSPLGWDHGRAGSWRARELSPAAGYVAWLVWSAAAPRTASAPRSAQSSMLAPLGAQPSMPPPPGALDAPPAPTAQCCRHRQERSEQLGQR